MHPISHHLRAAAVLGTMALTLLLSTPGLDQLGETSLVTESSREKARKEPLGRFTVALADLNRAVRLPIVRIFTPVQRPLRLAQSWSLYGGGPSRVRRLEIEVDGVLRHRSKDPEADWLAPTLRYRRIRPILSAFCNQKSKSGDQMMQFVARRARRDFPGAKEVVVRCTSARWPGTGPAETVFEYRATAPDWTFAQ